jgi:hypothetical protein
VLGWDAEHHRQALSRARDAALRAASLTGEGSA